MFTLVFAAVKALPLVSRMVAVTSNLSPLDTSLVRTCNNKRVPWAFLEKQ